MPKQDAVWVRVMSNRINQHELALLHSTTCTYFYLYKLMAAAVVTGRLAGKIALVTGASRFVP